uniref:Uncharacterized protein n=1 Tax=Rhizophora mucronata TaxID=61149 RepID=A0A2P2J735_RHIMU
MHVSITYAPNQNNKIRMIAEQVIECCTRIVCET